MLIYIDTGYEHNHNIGILHFGECNIIFYCMIFHKVMLNVISVYSTIKIISC